MRGQASSAYDVFCKKDFENAVRFMSNVMAPEPHGHNLCYKIVFFHWEKRICRLTEMVRNVETDSKRSNDGFFSPFELKYYAPICTKSLGMYTRDPPPRDRLQASLPETGI